jgi:hypothetical protein
MIADRSMLPGPRNFGAFFFIHAADGCRHEPAHVCREVGRDADRAGSPVCNQATHAGSGGTTSSGVIHSQTSCRNMQNHDVGIADRE